MENFNNEEIRDLINQDEDPLKDGPTEEPALDSSDLEVLPGSDPLVSSIDELNKSTLHGLPAGAAETIRNGRDLLKKQTDEAKQVSGAIGALFQDLNKRYGFDIAWDPYSFSENLRAIITSTNQKALDLYISEGYSKVRSILYQQFLSAITVLSSKVLDPAYLMSNSLSFEDQMTTIEKLFGLLEQMNAIYDQVHVENIGEKLEHLKTEDEDSKDNTMSLADPNVRAYLDAFRKAIQNQKELPPSKEGE